MFNKVRYGLLFLLLVLVSSCTDIVNIDEKSSNNGLDSRLQKLAAQMGADNLQSAEEPPEAKAELGRMLYHDKLLSGTKDVSCATCHNLKHQTADGLSLSIGVGGKGEGPDREMADANARNPRNATIVINRGPPEYHAILLYSRIAETKTVFISTSGDDLPEGLDNMLAVQALTPVIDRGEMLGEQGSEDIFGETNEIAMVEVDNSPEVWRRLMQRLMEIPEYVQLFKKAYPNIPEKELSFVHAANALAAFQISAFTFTESPWDQYLAGNQEALSRKAKRGGLLFFGKAKCAQCHNGPLLSDQEHHNIAVPQLGPGKGEEAPLDLGRYHVTNQEIDQFKFRTPPLRNVAITGPWMHNGAYTDLKDAIRHHLDPEHALNSYDITQLAPDIQKTYLGSDDIKSKLLETVDPILTRPTPLSEKEVDEITAFLKSLTTPEAQNLSNIIPDSVPSGLPVDD
jgi:cytochrome c peroxidase